MASVEMVLADSASPLMLAVPLLVSPLQIKKRRTRVRIIEQGKKSIKNTTTIEFEFHRKRRKANLDVWDALN